MFRDTVLEYSYLIPVILFSLSFHEFSHALSAYLLGDSTAKNQGRLTLNPLKHLDLFGTILIFIIHFGYAKPVYVNPDNFKRKKLGILLVSLAGPLANIVVAFFSLLLCLILINNFKITPGTFYNTTITQILYNLGSYFFSINIGLAAFNLLPIPPLDGSSILQFILPKDIYNKYLLKSTTISLLFMAVILLIPSSLNIILSPVIDLITEVLLYVSKFLIMGAGFIG